MNNELCPVLVVTVSHVRPGDRVQIADGEYAIVAAVERIGWPLWKLTATDGRWVQMPDRLILVERADVYA